ncbi:MAG: hypothetical protein HY700_14125 [Gemmatimonadetes bacterium]|nr:hypothetical protein [Gemmatimonadota bacterium]
MSPNKRLQLAGARYKEDIYLCGGRGVEADHELEAATSPREALRTEPFATGVWDQMIAWVLERFPAP